MKAPVERCPRGHGELKAEDRGAYFQYKCNRCEFEVKNYKPAKINPGDKKKFGPER